MSAYEGVKLCFNKPIVKVAQEFGYNRDNILILSNDLTTLKSEFPDTYSNLISCAHHKDKRTPIQYGQDLIASWLFEDAFLKSLNTSNKFSVELNGADKNRKILSNTRTSASSDYLIVTQNKKIKLELMCDYTGFWSRTEKLHLRDEKYNQLCKSDSLLIAVSPGTNEFALFDFSKKIEAKYIKSHKFYGGKPAYELSIPNEIMKPIISNEITSSIERLLAL